MPNKISQFEAEALKYKVTHEKSFGVSQYARLWLAGLDDEGNLRDSKTTKPYGQVSLVFTCVEKIISSMLGLPLVLSTIDEKIIESGPVYDLLFNSPLIWEKFVTDTIGHWALSRDVFWVFTDIDGAGQPKEIMIVNGKQMKPITTTRTAGGILLGWEFQGTDGKRPVFTIDEVCQWKNFNPYDKFHGLDPATAARLDIDYSFAAALYNASALANGAEPGLILTMPGSPSEEQVRMNRAQFDARHKGAGKAKRTALLAGGMDVKTVAMKMTDMQVAKITELSDKKICSAFGVPPGVAGLITDAQYSHGPAMRDFIFNTVIPLSQLFSGQITSGIISRFSGSKWLADNFNPIEVKDAVFYCGRKDVSFAKNKYFRAAKHKAVAVQKKVFAWFDASVHPVVQEHEQEKAEKVTKFVEAGVPLNDIIVAHDLPYPLTEAGKFRWVNMGQVPADYILVAGPEGITGPAYTPPPEEESSSKNQESRISEPSAAETEKIKASIWDRWVASWLPIEREYHSTLRVFFIRQERELTKKLKAALESVKSVAKATDDIIARVVFDMKKENGKLKIINHTFFNKASELGIRQSIKEITGLKGDELDKLTEQVKLRPAVKGKLVISNVKLAKVNEVTQRLVAKTLREGLNKNENLTQLTERIKKQLGSNRARAQRIARTQTGGAVNTGRHEGLKAAGVELKSWLTAKDEDVRTAHRQAESDSAAGIPINQPFNVGGELLMYPGDPSGSAANIINCRCMQIARLAAGKQYDLSYYSKISFVALESVKSVAENKESENED